MQIQISWLLKKPTDLDLHCFQIQVISRLSMTRVNKHSDPSDLQSWKQSSEMFYWNWWYNIDQFPTKTMIFSKKIVSKSYNMSIKHSFFKIKSLAQDEMNIHTNVFCFFLFFLFSPQKHMLWLLTVIILVSNQNIFFSWEIRKKKTTLWFKYMHMCLFVCLCWVFTAQSTQWGHVERSQFI